MNNNLEIFKNEQFGEVRTVAISGEPWFCLLDICSALKLDQPSRVKDRLKKDGVTYSKVTDSIGREQDANFINEPNLYKCIFQSRTEKAEKFQDWITDEVIPQIRKTGMYANIPKTYSEALRMYANEIEQKELMQKQRDEAIKTKALIGSKREATAMATASVKSRECEKFKSETEDLKVKLDMSNQYATIKFCESKLKRKFYWRGLFDYCNLKQLEMKKVPDSNYGQVNSYPAEAWKEVYGVRL